MFSILVSVLFVVGPAIAITLPNGFTFDEKLYFKVEPRLNYALEKCENMHGGCSNDCSTQFYCNGNNIVDPSSVYPCDLYAPYCVKDTGSYPMCAGNFPMTSQACLTKATNNFVCTEDGQFPDPTDCSKFHVCNGTAHSIEECPASHQFSSDLNIVDPSLNPGDGEFRCRFKSEYESCMCNRFYSQPNSFVFRSNDYLHYAYFLQIGTMYKAVMFKCPSGTRHPGYVNTAGTVDCVPIGQPFN